MIALLNQSSFFLYEISFILIALALYLNGIALRRIYLSLLYPPYWVGAAIGSVLFFMCALNHLYVYQVIMPQFQAGESVELLRVMHVLKSVSMVYIFIGSFSALVSNFYFFYRQRK
jgi:hypothetical protein